MNPLLDAALDLAVVPGYTRIGHALRRRGWPDDDPAPAALSGRRALVTGAGSGLGLATAERLAELGATVHLLVRDERRGKAALAQVQQRVPSAQLHLERCDVADLDDVRRFAAGLTARVDRLDVLVHNAGTLPAEHTVSVDGHELTVATHVLGPVLMTELLLPVLADHDARVVLVSSGGMYAQPLPLDDLDYRRGRYRGTTAYARSKRMQVALAPLLQQRWAAYDVGVHVMHPGWADTPGVARSLPLFRSVTGPLLRDADGGADTAIWLAATARRLPGGRFWQDRTERPTHYLGLHRETADDRARLLDWVCAATGLERR